MPNALKSRLLSPKKAYFYLALAINLVLVSIIVAKEVRKHHAVTPNWSAEATFVSNVELPADENAELPVGGFGEISGQNSAVGTFSLFTEWRLVKSDRDGDYDVETYQQYEIYKDPKGKIVKTVPTENFQYLRYCTGCEGSAIVE